MKNALADNHFALFGLPEKFAIDGAALDQAYRAVQSRVHPDRHTHAGDVEQRRAMQWASLVNEAYQTLSRPVRRAAYLCNLHGVDLQVESNTSMPPAFLMQQMEWRECLEEARAEGAGERLDALDDEVRQARRAQLADVAHLLDMQHDHAQAAQVVRQLMFIEKFAAELDDAREALGI